MLLGDTLARLDTSDRAMFMRCTDVAASRQSRIVWTAITHLGGPVCTIALVLIPLLAGGQFALVARQALATLVLSHLMVQAVKRAVSRERPSLGCDSVTLVAEPDRFSFPSGHAAAAMSIAIAYAPAFHSIAIPIVLLATMVGASRVFLGVHYPGDVLAGQLLALFTYLLLQALV